MTDRPIIFSASMMRALLAGRKTQTRRVLNPQPNCLNGGKPLNDGYGSYSIEKGWSRLGYASGDRLWVREAWRTFVSLEIVPPRDLYRPGERGAGVLFEADDGGLSISAAGEIQIGAREDRRAFGKLRPPIHMPRWASRLTLIITDVSVQRLQDIGEDDAHSEGVCQYVEASCPNSWGDIPGDARASLVRLIYGCHKAAFCHLWQSIHGLAAWEANPWVAAITFTVEQRNIDQLRILDPIAPKRVREDA